MYYFHENRRRNTEVLPRTQELILYFLVTHVLLKLSCSTFGMRNLGSLLKIPVNFMTIVEETQKFCLEFKK